MSVKDYKEVYHVHSNYMAVGQEMSIMQDPFPNSAVFVALLFTHYCVTIFT